MVRVAAFFLLFSSLTLTAQKTEIVYLSFLQQTICGPIGVQVRILDSSQDRPCPFKKLGSL